MKPATRPLASASQRLRQNPPPGFPGPVGRPRRAPVEPVSEGSDGPVFSHGTATRGADPRAHSGRQRRPEAPKASALPPGAGGLLAGPEVPVGAVAPLAPRLLDLDGASAYLGVSTWTLKGWLRRGLVQAVPMPARVMRLDRVELDAMITRWEASRGG